MGKIVIMGRRTFESLPGRQPLKGRENIVLTRKTDFHAGGIRVVHSIPELLTAIEGREDDAFVIGGGTVYEALISQCDRAYITMIERKYDADTWFPALDEAPDWELVKKSDEMSYFDMIYRFLEYARRLP